jgi:acyl CoA:acetate/3-ketoacid CoA transferase beta subunit
VVTDRAVLDFAGPEHCLRLRSVHPGVSVRDVQELTGFELAVPMDVPVTRSPTPDELALIRGRLDPAGLRERELG